MKIFKKVISVIMSIMCSIGLLSCNNIKNTQTVYNNFDITVLDVGKADAMILKTKNHTIVIDCGEKSNGKDVVNYLKDNSIDTIDYLIITHFDKDHVGGASKVIKNLDVLNIIQPSYEKSSSEYSKYCEAMADKNIQPTILTSTLEFTLDDVSFTIYPPQQDYYGENEENDFSLVVSAIHGENSFLFAGDAEETRLDEIMSLGNIQHDFLKVPYHGNSLSNMEDFLKKVNPKYAVICCSKKEYASNDTISLLNNMNIQTYITADNGQINSTSDGYNIAINTQE